MQKKITLNELPQYSPWVARLLSLEPLTYSPKTQDKVYKEYNDEKYGGLSTADTMEEAIDIYLGPDIEMPISRHNELFVQNKYEAYAYYNSLIVDSLRPLMKSVSCVVDLGAGFGQTIHFLQKEFPNLTYVAGEFTQNGLQAGERLLPGVRFLPFNFFDKRWKIFDGLENVLVLTVHAVEMCPDASLFVEHMQHYSSQIARVVNIEPIYENDGSLLSLLRQSYIRANGYCQNILQSVPNAKVERDFFGTNPLFCGSRMEWKP